MIVARSPGGWFVEDPVKIEVARTQTHTRPHVIRSFLLAVGVGTLVACGASSSSVEKAPEADLTLRDLPVQMAIPTLHTFDQVLDHASQTTDTVNQRYWFSKGFATTASSPTILYICGEGPCSIAEGVSVADTARGLGAAVLIVEHRYYGESLPFATPKVGDMKYLNIHNALEDLAAIQKSVAREQGIEGKWISAGGSYAGMLAAFYRLKHPELVAGAWASSAPVNVVKKFTGYDARAARTLGPTCALLTRQAMASVATQFADPARKKEIVERWWGRTLSEAQVDQVDPMWISWGVSSDATFGAQYGKSKNFCDALVLHESNPLDGWLGYARPPLFADAFDDAGAPPHGPGDADAGVTTTTASADRGLSDGGSTPPTGFPRFHRYPAPADEGGNAENDFTPPISAWDYQTCTEVGFFQVHNDDQTESVFDDAANEALYTQGCTDTYNTQPDIEGTRKTYYEPLMAGAATNILFTNGTEDPWSTLSLTDASAAPAGISVFVVQGGSHCSDLTNLSRTSSLGVFEAHVRLNTLAKGWLGL